MKSYLLVAIAGACIAQNASAALIDTFTRTDGSTVTDSLGTTEVGGISYLERGNTAGQSIPIGTSEISNNQLLLTGSKQTVAPDPLSNTGGAYLSGTDYPDVRVGADIAFQLVGNAPNGTAGNAGNKFNNTFLLMLRSRSGQNFAAANSIEDGLVAIEFNPNGDLLVREQRGGALGSVISRNYFTNASPVREPLPSILPATYGSGSFDVNGNGYLDENEPIHFEALLMGTSLKIFVNGAQYGTDYTLTNSSAAAGQLSGIGLHKNRIGSSNLIVSNILVDNLDVTVVPEPCTLILMGLGLCGNVAIRRRAC